MIYYSFPRKLVKRNSQYLSSLFSSVRAASISLMLNRFSTKSDLHFLLKCSVTVFFLAPAPVLHCSPGINTFTLLSRIAIFKKKTPHIYDLFSECSL